MSFESLLNETCFWTRKVNSGFDQYRAQKTVSTVISSNVKCRVDPVLLSSPSKDLEEIGLSGELNRFFERIFFLGLPDIKADDIVIVDGDTSGAERKVIVGPQNAGGHDHHTEIIVERLKIA